MRNKTICINDTVVEWDIDLLFLSETWLGKQDDESVIAGNGFKVSFYAMEIGSRGFINDRNKKQIKVIHRLFNIKESFKVFVRKLSKIYFISSFVIYRWKDEPTWTPHQVLTI